MASSHPPQGAGRSDKGARKEVLWREAGGTAVGREGSGEGEGGGSLDQGRGSWIRAAALSPVGGQPRAVLSRWPARVTPQVGVSSAVS